MTRSVLITGADGYLGSLIVDRYLRLTDRSLTLWVRAQDDDERREKERRLDRRFGEYCDRIGYSAGDLTEEEPFDGVDPSNVREVVHTAAVTRFNVDENTGRRVNAEGTARLLRFAERCPRLEAVGLLSTIYTSGMQSGPIEERFLPNTAGFANFYEQSKWEAENLLQRTHGHLPWRLLRIATVITDDESGRVSQFNAFHNTLKLLYYGLLSVVPGDAATPIYLVTGDFAADAVFEAMRGGEPATVYHVCHEMEDSLTLGQVLDLGFDVFGEADDFRTMRILKPLLCDSESFELLSAGMGSLSGPVGQALGSIAPFARQLFVAKDVRNDHLRSVLRDYRASDARQLMVNTCRYLVRTKWGREGTHAPR